LIVVQIQDGDAPEIQKKVLFCFRIMSRSFADPAKAEENYQILDQLKDANIWKILTNLVDPNTGFHQACTFRVGTKLLISTMYFRAGFVQVTGLGGMGGIALEGPLFNSFVWT
jgi:hypothetical protein